MAPNEKLAELSEAGVAVWLDDLSATASAAAACSHSSTTTPSSAHHQPDHLRRRDQRLRRV